MDSKIFYQQEKDCPVCERKFTVTRVRTSHCIVDKRDEDFCIHYQGINPYLYAVWVCPYCGYAASENIFSEINKEGKEIIALALKGKEIKINFSGERPIEIGIASYKLAIYCCELQEYKHSILAGLYLKTAWLYRELKDLREKDYLTKALEHYEKAYDNEPLPIGNLTDLALRYLIGELYRRIGEYREAIQWFNRVVSDSKSRLEPKITNMAREQWRLAKEELHNQSLTSEIEALEMNQAAVTQEEIKEDSKVENYSEEPKQEQSNTNRIKVSSMVAFYADQMEWVKKVVASSNEQKLLLDSQSIIRAVMDLIMDIDPGGIKCQTEEELTGFLRGKIRES